MSVVFPYHQIVNNLGQETSYQSPVFAVDSVSSSILLYGWALITNAARTVHNKDQVHHREGTY